MADISQGRAQDMILEYVVANSAQGRPVNSHKIWKDVFPELQEHEAYYMMRKIVNGGDGVAIAHVRSLELKNFEVFFEATALTTRFLQQGGFEKEYANEAAQAVMAARDKEIDSHIREDNLRLNKWNKIFLVINALLALSTFVWTIYSAQKPDDKTVQHILQPMPKSKPLQTENNNAHR